jgi:biotin operon repressor
MRGDPREANIEKLVKKLRALGVDIHHQNHQMIYSVNKVSVNATGIVLN